MASKPETRLQELHIQLPPAPKPVAKYKIAVQVGNMLYVSGHGPAKVHESTPLTGRIGENLTLEQGKEAAKAVAINVLATVKETIGSLDKVKRIVKTLGWVNCTVDFKDQPKVINGFSELMAEIFGESRYSYWNDGNSYYDNEKLLLEMKSFLSKSNKTEIPSK